MLVIAFIFLSGAEKTTHSFPFSLLLSIKIAQILLQRSRKDSIRYSSYNILCYRGERATRHGSLWNRQLARRGPHIENE